MFVRAVSPRSHFFFASALVWNVNVRSKLNDPVSKQPPESAPRDRETASIELPKQLRWASEEPFGWATYHYGRWGYSDRMGWFWVPGNRWAPAWVAWRQHDDLSGDLGDLKKSALSLSANYQRNT